MSRYFVIGIDSTNKSQADAIREWIEGEGINWWHWVDGMWLLISDKRDLRVSTIRDQINTLAPGVTNLVIEVKPITWSGFGPKSEARDMFKWLRENWKT